MAVFLGPGNATISTTLLLLLLLYFYFYPRYYPHHFAPWITDIKGFTSMTMDFEMSAPFKPFQQLMAVLPAASRAIVPPCYHWLMTSLESPIVDYYPQEFEQDLNGKQQEWEAVVMIPFILEARLLEAMAPLESKLTADEVSRNTHGPMVVARYSVSDLGPYRAPAYFPTVERSHAEVVMVHRSAARSHHSPLYPLIPSLFPSNFIPYLSPVSCDGSGFPHSFMSSSISHS